MIVQGCEEMTETAYNFLTEPLIQTNAGPLNLPALLAAMARGEVTDFTALRPHQRPAWHMFLVQLAVLALSRAGETALVSDETKWRDCLRSLTPDFPDDEPWCLVSPGAKPAFIQPPVHDAGGEVVMTPDALDMLITTRGHDLKMAVARQAEPQDWIYALVSLQTMEGYGGPTWYGIARMNGGSSSRAMVTLAPALPDGKTIHPSLWWQRDVRRLIAQHTASSKPALVWLLDWDGKAQLNLSEDLDPLFIEICRRVRLRRASDGLTATKWNSKKSRIVGVNGLTGDPWAPVSIKKPRTLSLSENGSFRYKKLHELLMSGQWKIAPLCEPQGDEVYETVLLVAEAFARGNCVTGGFCSRVVPISKTVVQRFLGKTATDQSDLLLQDISRVDRALRNALAFLAANGVREDITSEHYTYTKTARDQLDTIVDGMFFPKLWKILEAETEAAQLKRRAQFMAEISDVAREIFREFKSAVPVRAVFRHRAEIRAGQRLEDELKGALRDSHLIEHLGEEALNA